MRLGSSVPDNYSSSRKQETSWRKWGCGRSLGEEWVGDDQNHNIRSLGMVAKSFGWRRGSFDGSGC